jgi:hypothetical protein
MARIDLTSSDSPKIYIEEVSGSLQIKGWDENSIRIEIEDQQELDYSFEGDKLKLSADNDCHIRVPSGSSLEIEEVAGNANIVAVEGAIKVAEISGNLSMKSVGPTTITEVAGNLNIRGVEGDLNVVETAGNANLREAEGNVSVETDGNAELRLELNPGGIYKVTAGGNLFCHIDPPGNALVHLTSESEHIVIYTESEKQTRDAEEYEFKLGKGGADLNLSAGGHIDFRCRERSEEFSFGVDLDFVDDIAGLADEISEQVGAAVGPQIEALNEQLTALGDRLRNSGSHAAHQAERRVARAQQKLERKLHGRAGRVIVTSSVKPVEPVSAKERALILQMVQDKKINVNEAEMLLNTLEGRKPVDSPEKSEPAPSAKPEEEMKGEENA